MTRYLNFCKNAEKKVDDKPIDELPKPTKYEVYKESYEFYNKSDKRKEFMKEYNKQYRINHSNTIACECGVVYKDISKYAHKRSLHHLKYVELNNK